MTVPDIDYLKDNAQVIQYFGLGFVQIKINEELRYHFYHPYLEKTSIDDIHNHRCTFKSKILYGELHEELYKIVEGDDYFVKVSKCKAGVSNELLDNKVSVKKIMDITYYAGSSYYRYPKEFHTVSNNGICITELTMIPPKYDSAIVLIKDKSEVDYCPFKSSYTINELWAIVYQSLEVVKC